MTVISILGHDHGETTGLSLMTVVPHDPPHLEMQEQLELPWYEATLWSEAVAERWTSGTLLIACERFIITAGTIRVGRGDENWTIEGIGCARRDARKFGHRFTLKSASDSKKFTSNERLKQAGWYHRNSGHARDATRIAVITAAEELGIAPPWV